MTTLMTAQAFVDKLLKISKLPTFYGWGTFGQKISNQLIRDKSAQYPYYWDAEHIRKFRTQIDKAWSFDCVGLVKGPLWGFDETKPVRYRGTAVPDTSADGMIKLCYDVSEDFSNIEIGEFVWMPVHCGVYIGNGMVVEATPIWDDGVQVTELWNLKKSQPRGRRWHKHGKLPWIDYANAAEPQKPTPKPQTKPQMDTAIHYGDKVKVLHPIIYGTDRTFKLWYKVYDVLEVIGDRAVIGIGKTVTSAIHISNIEKVKGA